MRAVKTLGVVLCSALGGLGCESKEPLVLPDGPVDDTSCVGFSAALTPTVGEGPLHRGTPIVATWRTGIVDAQVEVHADGAAVRGATYVHDGRAMFLAERLLPASTRIDWRFSACGTMHAGHFDTGALSAPVEFEDAVGRSFGFDLRQLEWEHPTANTTANGYVLRWHLAPTVVVDVLGATLSSVHVAIAPGVVTEKGDVVRDLSASHVEVHAGSGARPVGARWTRHAARRRAHRRFRRWLL
jgi:hypothetical protein